MKEFFKKAWAWVLKNEVVSIVVASVFDLGSTCAIVLPSALKHKHDFGTELKHNSTHHYLECECGEKKDEIAHAYDNACDNTCDACGATRVITHDYATTLSSDAEFHWYECLVCGDKKDKEAHEASNAYSKNATHHWKDCLDCGYDLNVQEHSFTLEVANQTYFKEETNMAVVYYKSCVCGEKGGDTDTFVVNKTVATLENVALPAEIIYGDSYDVNFTTNSNGQVTIHWFEGSQELNNKPTEAGNNYTVKVSVAGNSQYTPVESQLMPFEIKPYTLTGLQTTVEYNGTMYHFVSLDDIAYGLRLDISFNSENVGATPTAVNITLDSEPTTNYVIDTSTCVVEIVAKEVELEWNAPNLTFDLTEKIPTVTATGLCSEDVCNVEIIMKDGDNRWYGSTFTYEATGLTNANYKLPTNVVSPEYTIEDLTEMVVGTGLLVYQYVPYGAPSYFKINLEAGDYIFDFCPDSQSAKLSVEIYKKGDFVDEIVEIVLGWPDAQEVAFKIVEDGEYYIKCNQVNDFEPQYDTIEIIVDEHTTPNNYGFCSTGCGTYLGDTDFDTNVAWTTVTLEAGEKAYFRFADAEENTNVQYNYSFLGEHAGVDIKVYAKTNNGTFEDTELTDTAKDVVASFDNYYYVVITASQDVTIKFQIEETYN